MRCPNERFASPAMTGSSHRPRQSLSRSHRTVHGEITLCLYDAQHTDARGLWVQGTSGVSGYCGTAAGDKPWLPSGALDL